MSRRNHMFVLLGVAAVWCTVYVTASWPRLGGPLSAAALLAHGALPTPLPAAQWPRLVTTWLVHVDALHLLGNLAAWGAAWLPGPAAHRSGAAARLAAFVCCGLGASLTVLFWYGQQPSVSVGPSGALLGLLLVLLVQRGHAPLSRIVWALASAALFIGGALTGGDTAAHLGGASVGLVLGLGGRARDAVRRPPR